MLLERPWAFVYTSFGEVTTLGVMRSWVKAMGFNVLGHCLMQDGVTYDVMRRKSESLGAFVVLLDANLKWARMLPRTEKNQAQGHIVLITYPMGEGITNCVVQR